MPNYDLSRIKIDKDGRMDYSGCHYLCNDHLGFDDRKNVILVEEEPTDLIEYMNAYAEESDIHNIVKRAQILGVSLDVATHPESYNMDFAAVPDNINEQNSMKIALNEDSQAAFSKLPKEVTGGLSLSEFLKALGSDDVKEYVKSRLKSEVKDEKSN